MRHTIGSSTSAARQWAAFSATVCLFVSAAFAVSCDNDNTIAPTFEQLDSTSIKRHEGSGLGLHLSHKLASLLGAEVQVESTHGAGTTFTLVMPVR